MLTYENLRLAWWLLLGVLLCGFAVMDGFDLGTAALSPFLGRNDGERRVIINTIGPVWEGNQVWLILGAGAIFAAWPMLYAVAFSGFYLAMLVVLLSLILRPAAIVYRSKVLDARWRSVWDWLLFISGVVPPVIFGVAVGNAFEGVPFTFDDTMRLDYEGSFFGLLNPFALLCGIVSLCMILTQGASWLAVKTDAGIQKRARKAAIIFAAATFVLFLVGGQWLAGLEGYRIVSVADPNGPSNPMLKTVARVADAWLDNYHTMPASGLAPVTAILGALLALLGAFGRKALTAFLGSSLMQIGIIATAGVSLFPFLLPSSLNPDASLTVWDASSSRGTLITMLVVTLVFVPVILAYTGWVYYVLRGKVTTAHIRDQGDSLY
jgi:cytochrome d ubiquinol oxidase subunit II